MKTSKGRKAGSPKGAATSRRPASATAAPARAPRSTPPRNAGATYTVSIDSLAAGTGAGVGRITSGKVVFVDDAVVGQTVTAQAYRDSERHAQARVVEVLRDIDRTGFPVACPHTASCGGCRFQGVPYELESTWKFDATEESVRRLARTLTWPTPDRHPSPSPTGWRSRVRWAVNRAGELGYHAHRSHDVVQVDSCNVLTPELEQVLQALSKGSWRGATAIFAEQSAGVIGLEVSLTSAGAGASVAARLKESLAECGFTRWAAATTFEGRPALHVWLGGTTLVRHSGPRPVTVTPGGFSQANALLLPVLMERVLGAVDASQGVRVLELFAGFGQFTHAIAAAGAQVLALEGAGAAVSAGKGARTSGVTLMEYDLSDGLPADLERRAAAEHVILVDPPRAGLGETLARQLSTRPAQRLVYVSCDAATMARDATVLAEGGWAVREWSVLDMYPRTHHVEALVVFERGGVE